MEPCWQCFTIYTLRTRAIGRFFMPVSVWARTRFSRTRKPLIDGLWPDVFRGQETSISRAKRAITDYKQAIGEPEGLVELMVFYCERAVGFCRDVRHQDTAYFDALVRTFEQALKTSTTLAAAVQSGLLTRLDRVRSISHELGYGIGDEMDVLLAEFVQSFQHRGASWR